MSDLPSSPSAAGHVSGQSVTSTTAASAVARSPGELRPAKPPMTRFGKIMFWLFGIILPAAAITYEAITHACAGALYDPIPTCWQLALVALVPVANFATWLAIMRARLPRTEITAVSAGDNRHIARLWGLGEIERLATASEPGGLDRAIKLALQLQLVTRVSGAVVLERKEQYDRAGLTPSDPQTVPTIPEPGTALLLLFGGGALLMRRRRS